VADADPQQAVQRAADFEPCAELTPKRCRRDHARSRDNLGQFPAALREPEALVYAESAEGLAFDFGASTLFRAPLWNLATNASRLDVACMPSGTEGFADLSRDAVRFEV